MSKQKKKILFLHVGLGVGGAEQLRYALLKNIDRDRYDIKLCCIKKKGKIGEKIEKLGYKVDELGQDHAFKNIKTTVRVIRYLKSQKIDILQTSLFDSNFHGRIAALACGIPNVITEEHSDHYQYRGIKFLPYVMSDYLLAKMTKVIVCCSETLRADIISKERLPANKVITIRNCIDPSMYRVNEPRDSVRQRFNINNDELVFITVATLCNRKGHIYLIEALKRVNEKGVKFSHFMIGDGDLKDLLYERCKDYGLTGKVIFLGAAENVPDYLNASDVFVLPSIVEGLPLVLIEAMFMGLATIVTDVGANRELVSDNVNGIIVPPADSEKLANAILFYFGNKRKITEFGLKNKQNAQEHCLIHTYVQQFYNLWDTLA
ncbi:MAG: glycosyltransferase [Candidatus Omnitrophica bacterium]|nr:glycosyltransferase [Candidatus Omnitrophota bacterium]